MSAPVLAPEDTFRPACCTMKVEMPVGEEACVSLITELRRSNVLRAGAAHLVAACLHAGACAQLPSAESGPSASCWRFRSFSAASASFIFFLQASRASLTDATFSLRFCADLSSLAFL